MPASDPASITLPVKPGPFKSLLDKNHTKPDLQAICIALNISIEDDKGKKYTKDQLLPVLKKCLFVDELSLQDDPTFAALYGTTQGGKGGAKKTSADKNAEVAAEQSKPSQELTGANLKLHSKGVAMDPPPSYGPLGLSIQGHGKNTKAAPAAPPSSKSSSELTPTRPSTPVPDEEEQKNLEEEEKNIQFSAKLSKGIVFVKFSHPHRLELVPQEVTVDGISITNSIAPGGALSFHASLKDLVPANPPFQKIAHLDGPVPKSLDFTRTDTMMLHPTNHLGEYRCNLFYEPSDTLLQPAAPTSLTGASSDRPQEIAQARAIADLAKKDVTIKTDPQFGEAIRKAARIPDKLKLPTNTTAKIDLLNFRQYDNAFNKFQVFHKKKAYAIGESTFYPYLLRKIVMDGISEFQPALGDAAEEWTKNSWDKYRGCTFTKVDLTHSLGLSKSATLDNHNNYGAGKKLTKTRIGKYIREAHLEDHFERILKLEGKYDNIEYGIFCLLIKAKVELEQEEKPGPSKLLKKRKLEDAEEEEEDKKKKKTRKEVKQALMLEIAEGAKGKGKGKEKGKRKNVTESRLDS
ncbi:hypothetical protein DFH07DRAFT_959268 [Mycena maculata]|uniref:Uncharacterized protein n=1 Tax=Mycena maculata TaxID=230809 RepID=A0AAD7J5Q1_9AGAR|nr:hypothetical protein DFH07DRAFT_959268 [Mycena maculata]